MDILLDKKDKHLLAYSWSINKGYARGSVDGKVVYLHQAIMNAPKGFQVDHINGNRLDNRRSNLRVVSRMQNQQNRMVQQKNNTSGFKGVAWRKDKSLWAAQIRVETKLKHLGFFSDILEASKAYDRAAKEYFGAYARINNVS